MLARSIFAGFVLLFALSGTPSGASAQAEPSKVGTSPKGMIGLGLVGAELGLIIPAAFRVNNPWILTATGVVGAAGGALAGHYLLDNRETRASRGLSISFLALGLAGFIPTTLLVVRASRYHPDRDQAPPPDLSDAGGGLLRYSRGNLGLGVPALTVSRADFNRDVLDTQVALLSGRF